MGGSIVASIQKGDESPSRLSDHRGSKQHLTFPALKDYDSRGAGRERDERGKEKAATKDTQSVRLCHQTVSSQSTSVMPPVGTV